ncbi:MAG: ATP-binding cassette domain-containing protein [Pseudomonadota bacterium]
MSEPLLTVRALTKRYATSAGRWASRERSEFTAVDGVSFTLDAGRTLGIVGESGSGKTTLVRMILRAIDPSSGHAIYRTAAGEQLDLTTLTERELQPLRRELQMIFQDPFSSLNPRMTVQSILEEPLIVHGERDANARLSAVQAMLDLVALPRSSLTRFPHAFSGGQRQRISIARALILRPRLVVCDESVSALDVSVQAQVINLLGDLQQELGLTYLFVAHDLAVVRHICDEVLVLYRGRVVEQGPTETLFNSPQHDYTRLLLSAIPEPDPDRPLRPLDRATLNF